MGFTALEARKIANRHALGRRATAERMTNEAQELCRLRANKGEMTAVYTMPQYALGVPLFDLEVCMNSVILNLQKAGFIVRRIAPRKLHISWKRLRKADGVRFK